MECRLTISWFAPLHYIPTYRGETARVLIIIDKQTVGLQYMFFQWEWLQPFADGKSIFLGVLPMVGVLQGDTFPSTVWLVRRDDSSAFCSYGLALPNDVALSGFSLMVTPHFWSTLTSLLTQTLDSLLMALLPSQFPHPGFG